MCHKNSGYAEVLGTSSVIEPDFRGGGGLVLAAGGGGNGRFG